METSVLRREWILISDRWAPPLIGFKAADEAGFDTEENVRIIFERARELLEDQQTSVLEPPAGLLSIISGARRDARP
jgi:hypothetical protein